MKSESVRFQAELASHRPESLAKILFRLSLGLKILVLSFLECTIFKPSSGFNSTHRWDSQQAFG